MHERQPVEDILARLMPPGLSADGKDRIEAMLDGLAGGESHASARPHWRVWLAGGMAAALAVLAAFSYSKRHELNSAVSRALVDDVPPFELLAESNRIETISDEGWSETPDGAAMRATRLRVVEENRLLDHETGIVMHISEPRDEWLLTPVSAF